MGNLGSIGGVVNLLKGKTAVENEMFSLFCVARHNNQHYNGKNRYALLTCVG